MELTNSTSGGSEGGVMPVGLGDTKTRGSSTSSEMAIKIFFSLHLCLEKYFSSQL
jgi:hypothetical protein